MLIILIIGAMIVAFTLAPLGELLRHGEVGPLLIKCPASLSGGGTSEWSAAMHAAMRAKHHQANGIS